LRQRTFTTNSLNPARRKPSRHTRFDDNGKSLEPSRVVEDEKTENQSPDNLRSELEQRLPPKLGFKHRMRHFTWTWFTMTMATGGIANVLYAHILP
jgi:hypothetical protein